MYRQLQPCRGFVLRADLLMGRSRRLGRQALETRCIREQFHVHGFLGAFSTASGISVAMALNSLSSTVAHTTNLL